MIDPKLAQDAIEISDVFSELVVLEHCGSTQDEAKQRASGAGLVVLTDDQRSGRGRLGRSWHTPPGCALAATFVIHATRADLLTLPIRAGIAACVACERAAPSATLGIRWPNDIVERTASPGGGRKLAGVLIETSADLAYIGIGVNVRGMQNCIPEELERTATSLESLGADTTPSAFAAELVRAMDASLGSPNEDLVEQWGTRDVLLGAHCVFRSGQEVIEGIVRRILPSSAIYVVTQDGSTTLDPALATLISVEGQAR